MTAITLVFDDASVNSHKFWKASVVGAELTTTWGRLGTAGQTKTKTFATQSAAEEACVKAVNEKLAKGYVPDGPLPLAQSANAAVAATARIGVPDLRPMLANDAAAGDLPRYAADDRWWFQQKVDGDRVMLTIRDGVPTVLGRAGQDSKHAPRFASRAFAADLARLEDCTLDGELVGDVYLMFDLPEHITGNVTVDSPYVQRQNALDALFARWAPGPSFALLRTARTHEEKSQLALDCFRAGGEGIMLKDTAARYKPGKRVDAMLKAKFVRDADFVVTGVGLDGHDNYALSLWTDGKLVEIGRCSAIGKARCEIGDVVTVRFLYIGANGQLYQPRMMCRRDDKRADECVYDQVAGTHVNKTILA
jgi:ATP-dependent DNA ligase